MIGRRTAASLAAGLAAGLMLGLLPSIAHAAEAGMVTATFDPNGGTVDPIKKDVPVGTPASEFPTPTRDRANFLGWYSAATGGTKFSEAPATDFTAYAHWGKVSRLTVKFDTNGGGAAPADKRVAYDKKYGTLPTPKRAGYSFMGWHTVRQHGGTKVTSSSKNSSKATTLTLYARWAPAPLYQFDKRWRSLKYVSTMRGSGCGLTAMTIAVRAISGKNVTPKDAREYALKHNYDIRKPGRTKTGFFTKWPATYGIKVTPTNDKNKALQAVKDGDWVVAFMKPGRWTHNGHFIVWYDIAGSTALIRDPNATKASKVRAPYTTLQSQTWTGVKGNKHHRYYIVDVPDAKKLYKVG